MKKTLTNIGGLLLFYSIIFFGVLLLNTRFEKINNLNNQIINDNYVAMNK